MDIFEKDLMESQMLLLKSLTTDTSLTSTSVSTEIKVSICYPVFCRVGKPQHKQR